MQNKSFLTKTRWLVTIMLLLSPSISNLWGAETLYETIIMKDNGSDSGTAYTTSTAISTAFESPTDSIKAITSVSRVYPGNSGWKFGASSNPGSITFSLAHTIKKVTKIEVSVKRYNTKNVNLNCNNIGAQTINSSSYSTKTYTYTTATDISSITLVTTKPSSGDYRCYVQSIKIYYDKPASGTSVTLSKAATSNGSFTLSNDGPLNTATAQTITVTGTPNTGYYLSGVTQSGASSTPTITKTSATTYTIQYPASCTGTSTITATFSPIWELGYGEWGGSWGDPVAMTVADGVASCSVSLSAMTKYGFKFHNAQTNTWYGNNGMIITGITNWQFGTSGIYDTNCRLFTGPAGSYTFSINTSNAMANLSYPSSVSHPSAGYAYFKKQGSDTYIKIYTHHNDAACEVADWNNSVEVTNTISICNNDYFYFALTDAGGCSKAIIRYNNASSQKGDFTITSGAYSGKWGSVDDTNWHEFTSYTITFAGNGSDGGSMSPVTCISSGSSETLEANGFTKTDYTFTGWKADVAVTIGGSSVPAGTLIEDESTIQNITSDITLTAQWQIVADHYIDNIWEVVTADQTGEYTRPTIADQDPDEQTDCKHLHYHFVGWITKAKYDAGTAIAAGDIQATGSVTASNATFYAVWAKEDAGGGEEGWFDTNVEDLTSEDIVVIATPAGYAVSNNNGTSSAPTAVTITVSEGKITSTVENNIKWNVDGNGTDGYIFYPNGSTTTWLYCNTTATSGSNNNIRVGTGDRKYWIADSDGDYVTNDTYTDRWLCNYNNADFRGYIGSSVTSDIVSKFYKYNSGVSYTDYIASCGAEYDITLNKNGGTTNGSATVTANATALNSGFTAPVYAGHQVDYYMVASADNSTKIAEADGTLASGVMVSSTPWTDANGKWVKAGDATFYAKWKATECVITLNNEGATEPGTASVTATYGASTNLTTSIEIPAKNGYDFGGYFTETNGAGTQLVDANGAWLASKTGYTNASKQWQLDATSLELFAKWTIKSYTVTWVVNGTTEATQASVSYGTLYGNLTEEPTVAHNAIKDACGSDRFVGWVWQEYTGEGGTAGSQFEPYKATASTPIDDTHHTFYAMFATENGTAFTLDGEVGSTQDVHVYYTDGTTNYYATGNIGASSTGKINSTTDVTDANTYVFTKTGTGTYTIKKSGDTKYIKYKSSTDLDTQDDPYTWTISDVSSAGLGSWRLQSGTNQRAWICRTDGTPKFGGYSTTGVTVSQTYRDVELGSSNLTDYRTGCCSEKITLTVSDATSGVGGTVTMKWNNADKSSGNQVSTCSAGTLVAKITANPGYSLTAVTISGTNKAITTDPANLATGLPSTSEMTYTVSVQALATGTLTITPTFSQMYTVTYDLDGGETSGSTTTASYLPNTTVTFVTPNPTKSGYNFTGWVVNKAGGGTQSATSTNFSMPSDNVTVVAQWSAKPLSSITVTPTTATVYVGQYVELPVTYDPADILTKGYTLVSTPSWCVTTSSTQTTLKITGGRSGATINEDKTETVSIQANADNTKTASVTVTVKPLPVDHFVDLIHNVSFDDKGASIVNNVLQATYSAPGYATDYSGATAPGCETEHLHLIGWIDSEWADANPKATQSQITSAPGYHVAYEAGMTANNKTYYAVWGHEVVEP